MSEIAITFLSQISLSHYQQLLDNLFHCYKNNMEFIEISHSNFIQQQKEIFDTNKKMLENIDKQHEIEINNQHTVAFKMSMFKEYDRQIKNYQMQLDLSEKRLALAEKKLSNLSNQNSITLESNISQISTNESTMNDLIKLKKIKWKGVEYFHNPQTSNVYCDSKASKLVGKIENKKLVLL